MAQSQAVDFKSGRGQSLLLARQQVGGLRFHDEQQRSLWRVPIGGGGPVRITVICQIHLQSRRTDDGLLSFTLLIRPACQQKLAIIPFAGGRPAKILDLQRTARPRFHADFGIKWTPDGRALAYLDARNGVLNIWTQPLDSSGQVWSFAWSHDGKQLAMAHEALKSDAILIGDSQ